MNKAQVAVLAVAVLAGGGAFMIMSRPTQAPAPTRLPAVVTPIVPTMTDQVLVAKRDLPYGTALTDLDIEWMDWPRSTIPKGVITKNEAPHALEDLKGSFVRAPIGAAEPNSARAAGQGRDAKHDVDPALQRQARDRDRRVDQQHGGRLCSAERPRGHSQALSRPGADQGSRRRRDGVGAGRFQRSRSRHGSDRRDEERRGRRHRRHRDPGARAAPGGNRAAGATLGHSGVGVAPAGRRSPRPTKAARSPNRLATAP